MRDPLITIITSVYNGEQFLEQSIESVTSQSYPLIEYIIIDGGSKDQSVSIIRKHNTKISFWVSERDTGIYDAWNKALRHATGEWICFIGCDDFLTDSQTISTMAAHLKAATKKGHTLVYGKNTYIDINGNLIEVLGKEWDKCRDRFAKEMTLAHCGAFHHTSMFKRNGPFNQKFRIAGDYELLLREYKVNREFAMFVDLPVVVMRAGGISGNLESRLVLANETDMARKINGFTFVSWPVVLWKLRIRAYMVIKKLTGRGFANRMADLYRNLKGENKRWSR